MNRTIKYRIKDRHSGWFYGMPLNVQKNKEYCTFMGFDNSYYNVFAEVETLGQFTGLCDKNDKEIYEGDIIRMHYFFENYDPISLGAFEDEAEIIGVVKYELLDGFYVETVGDHRRCYLQWVEEPTEELEVLGNIYDNPEWFEEE